jgi:predicted TIM-barrel fold metal-dependent hydrolase
MASSLLARGCACCAAVHLDRRGFLAAALGAGAAAVAGAAPGAAQQGAAAKRVDVHHHFSPPEIAAQEGRGVLHNWTVERSLADMERGGVTTAMLSLTTSPGAAISDPARSKRTARMANEFAAGLVRDHPGRFGLFAAVPMPDVDATLAEIAYAYDTLKADGIGLFTSYGTKWLGDPAFEPVFDELERRKAVVYTHPISAPCCTDLLPNVNPAVIEYGTETTRTIASYVFGGMAARHPNVRIIFSHAGGTMPFLIERFINNAKLPPVAKNLPNGIMAELTRLYYDTAQSANPVAMGALAKIVPVSQIMFGTDYPYRTAEEHVRTLKTCGFSAADLAAIDIGNAERLVPRLRA